MDDPVNRVDAWGLWSLFGFGGEEQKSGEGNTEQSRTGRDDNPYCKVYPCDDNGTMQGDYKPIDIRHGAEPFVLDFSVPLPKAVTVPFGDAPGTAETRIPLGFDLVTPFRIYDELRKEKR